MRGESTALRAIGLAAFGLGFVASVARRGLCSMSPHRLAQRRWRTLTAGSICLRAPRTWGEVERLESGGYVIHNRARRHRIEGDAVWYGSAIELMIGPPDPPALPPIAPMREHRRTIEGTAGPIVASLRVANGVVPARDREALRVLRSIRANQA